MSKKYLIIPTIIVIFLIIILLVLLNLLTPKQTAPKVDIYTFPTSQQTITNAQPLILRSISPTENSEPVFLPIKQFDFTFSAPIDINTVSYQIIPDQKVTIAVDKNVLKIAPKEYWQLGPTEIRIFPGLKSINNNILQKEVRYKMVIGYIDGEDSE